MQVEFDAAVFIGLTIQVIVFASVQYANYRVMKERILDMSSDFAELRKAVLNGLSSRITDLERSVAICQARSNAERAANASHNPHS